MMGESEAPEEEEDEVTLSLRPVPGSIWECAMPYPSPEKSMLLCTISFAMRYDDSLGGSVNADWSKMVVKWSALGSTAMFGSKSRSMGKEKLKSELDSNLCSCAVFAQDESWDQSGCPLESKGEEDSPLWACACAWAAIVWRRNSSVSLGSDLSSAWGVVGEGEFVDDELELSDGGGVDMVAGGRGVLLYEAPFCAQVGADARASDHFPVFPFAASHRLAERSFPLPPSCASIPPGDCPSSSPPSAFLPPACVASADVLCQKLTFLHYQTPPHTTVLFFFQGAMEYL